MMKYPAQQGARDGSPDQLAAPRTLVDANSRADLVPSQVAVDFAVGTQFSKLVQDQLNRRAGLLIRFKDYFARRQFQEAARDGEDQVATLGLVELATLQPVAHRG
jgi:hypothetical protein